MKKTVEVEVYKDRVSVTNGTIHRFDKNVVEVKCRFNYNFTNTLEGVKATLVSKLGDIVALDEKTIIDNQCVFSLNNALFQEAGNLRNTIKLTKGDKELCVNDDFIIRVVGKESPNANTLDEGNIVLKRATLKEEITNITKEILKGETNNDGANSKSLLIEFLKNAEKLEILEFTGKESGGTSNKKIKFGILGDKIVVVYSEFYRDFSELTATEETKEKIKNKIKETILFYSPNGFSGNSLRNYIFEIQPDGKISFKIGYSNTFTRLDYEKGSVESALFQEYYKESTIYKSAEMKTEIDKFLDAFDSMKTKLGG